MEVLIPMSDCMKSLTIDTAADLIGTAVALDNLDLLSKKFYTTDVAVGNGLLKFSHGVVPNPRQCNFGDFK